MARDRSRHAAQFISTAGIMLTVALLLVVTGSPWVGVAVAILGLILLALVGTALVHAHRDAQQGPPAGSRKTGHSNR